MHEHLIKQLFLNFFLVHDHYKLVISLIAFIKPLTSGLIQVFRKKSAGSHVALRRNISAKPHAFFVIVITFNVIVIDCIVILFICNRNRAGGK